jgi:hypothetical protein
MSGMLKGRVALSILMLWGSVCAAAPVVTIKTDLNPLILAASGSTVQFAVQLPHEASLSTAGHWTMRGDRAEWQYAVRVPTAVSLSFHATQIRLPPSASLTVRSPITTVSYGDGDIRRGELWSRIQPGDSLQFTLRVANADRGKVIFEVQSLQAGYRALGPQVQDHPYYRQIRERTASSGNSSCVQNYECSVTPANTPVAQSTLGVVVGNLYQCTGTLINDVPSDNTPYVLTARHCENGQLGGGSPSAAGTVTVYWDATTPCGSTLGSIYDPAIVTQTGATTVVEQQDAWLIKLSENPVVTDAQFAGFDATGAAVQGGYTVQHSLGFDKQMTAWFGQAYKSTQSGVLGVAYVSQFLETVNQQGNIGPGASGSGLIDGNNKLVGSLTLGRTTSDTSGYGACPVTPLVAPTGSNGVADFTSFAAVWNSTADSTGSTGAATLQSILDPANTGTQIVSSAPAVNLNFAASANTADDGNPVMLTWNATNGTQCLAGGGLSGDGWSGTLPASGSRSVTETVGGSVVYVLTCQLSAGRQVIANTTVRWYGDSPAVFIDTFTIRWIDAPTVLTWTSNLAPCSITGGGLALTNLAGSGSTTATQNSPGDVTYSISCGSGLTATSSTTVTYITPALEFQPNGSDRLTGQPLWLYWGSYADTCIPSGGATGDRWSNNAFLATGQFQPIVTALGTYTYTLACTSGPNTVVQSVNITIENNAPYTTASATPTTVTYSATPTDYFTLSYKSNLTDCELTSSPVTLQQTSSTYPLLPSGASDAEDTITLEPLAPGTYTLTMTCNALFGGAQGTASATPIIVDVLPPPAPTATITVNPATVMIGQQFTVTWSSTNAKSCLDTGNAQAVGALWGLSSSIGTSGSQVLSTNEPGEATLGISCQSIDPNQASVSAQTDIRVGTSSPTATLSASPASVTIGGSFTLTWSSTNATACTESGGGADGSSAWSGQVSPSGSVGQTTTATGSFTYTIACTAGNLSAQSQAVVTVSAKSNPGAGSTSSDGSSHGGGEIGLLDLAALAALVLLSSSRRPIAGRTRSSHRHRLATR